MLIGVDFDNTIVCYEKLFHKAAVEQGLIPYDFPEGKGRIRDFLRESGKKTAWTELQGSIYGHHILNAPQFPGVLDFFAHCKETGVRVIIISHKTRAPFLGPRYDLHEAAHKWLRNQGFYHNSRVGLTQRDVFFELTKEEKLDRIKRTGCTHFVDDLPEFLEEPEFPPMAKRILFDPSDEFAKTNAVFSSARSWKEIEKIIKEEQALIPRKPVVLQKELTS